MRTSEEEIYGKIACRGKIKCYCRQTNSHSQTFDRFSDKMDLQNDHSCKIGQSSGYNDESRKRIGKGILITLVLLASAVQIGKATTLNYEEYVVPDLPGEPYFLAPLGNTTAVLGREAIMRCRVDDLNGFKVAWLRVDTQTVLTIHDHLLTRNNRFGLFVDPKGIFQLHIREVRESDRGAYMCQLNTDPPKSIVGYLHVDVPPDIIDEGTSSDQLVREGENVQLKCNAVGTPRPSVTWKRDRNEPIILTRNETVQSVEGPTLNLSRVTREHMGAYYCLASNGIPPTVSKRIIVVIDFPPVVRVSNQLVGAVLGADLLLECVIESYPRSIIFWTKENGEILQHRSSLETKTVEPLKNDYQYRETIRLMIRGVRNENFGTYTCIARNSLGDAEGTIKVYPIDAAAAGEDGRSNYNLDYAVSTQDLKTTPLDNGAVAVMSATSLAISHLLTVNYICSC